MDLISASYPLSAESIKSYLSEHQIQPTLQRIEIARLLFGKNQHLTAEDVLRSVNSAGSMVSKATVYNTLGLFAKRGLIRPIWVDGNRLFYDTNMVPHHHFYHLDTGQLTDVSSTDIKISQLPPLPEGTLAAGIDVVIRVCESEEAH
ncbi:MAG TPA: transcriptional repressor [Gammaproteobacteria bacterium]|nr:transcriptional repressor [Gammaproteobacteria bacterium]